MKEELASVYGIGAASAPSAGAAPIGYRVSVLPGALEVSARIASADDLDILVRVLEASKANFQKPPAPAKAVRAADPVAPAAPAPSLSARLQASEEPEPPRKRAAQA